MRQILLFATLATSLALLSGCTLSKTKADTAEDMTGKAAYHKISAEEAYEMMASQEVVVVDVRTREEYDGGHIENAVLVPNESIGSEMARFQDRSGSDVVLGMTHEEAAVQLARGAAKSHADYPFMIYQIQTKFRDEPRCRGGLIRVREFTMKDAYSFHTSQEDLEEYYEKCLSLIHISEPTRH